MYFVLSYANYTCALPISGMPGSPFFPKYRSVSLQQNIVNFALDALRHQDNLAYKSYTMIILYAYYTELLIIYYSSIEYTEKGLGAA